MAIPYPGFRLNSFGLFLPAARTMKQGDQFSLFHIKLFFVTTFHLWKLRLHIVCDFALSARDGLLN